MLKVMHSIASFWYENVVHVNCAYSVEMHLNAD